MQAARDDRFYYSDRSWNNLSCMIFHFIFIWVIINWSSMWQFALAFHSSRCLMVCRLPLSQDVPQDGMLLCEMTMYHVVFMNGMLSWLALMGSSLQLLQIVLIVFSSSMVFRCNRISSAIIINPGGDRSIFVVKEEFFCFLCHDRSPSVVFVRVTGRYVKRLGEMLMLDSSWTFVWERQGGECTWKVLIMIHFLEDSLQRLKLR